MGLGSITCLAFWAAPLSRTYGGAENLLNTEFMIVRLS